MESFKVLTHDYRDAYFNLASEEYLLKETDGYYFYLWINDPAVIVGVNQNAIEEVNLSYTQSHNVKVVRRLTGGGAVYHDGGNLCYTVIAPFDSERDNYKAFTAPVIEYLNTLGVKAEFSGRNDIVVDGKKISGNAQTVYKNRIMHHGTLLFSTDLDGLTKSLNPSKLKTQSKGIKSVRARVTNISDHLKTPMTMAEFKDGLYREFLKTCQPFSLKATDIERINRLKEEKYSTYKWNIGSSPKGSNKFTQKFAFGIFTLQFDTECGLIKSPEIYGDFFCKKDVNEFKQKLDGLPLEKTALIKAFSDISDYVVGADGEEIINALLGD
ncbi:MAG: lipoate--protein ligase [Clostridiales bacterium]|nr:lipoate--protein ligase [Clostridiales bacterium]